MLAVKDVVEVHQWFSHREDKLVFRQIEKQTNTVIEQFGPGRPQFLKGLLCRLFIDGMGL